MKILSFLILLLSISACFKDDPTIEEIMKDKNLMLRLKQECRQIAEEQETPEKCINLDKAIKEALKSEGLD